MLLKSQVRSPMRFISNDRSVFLIVCTTGVLSRVSEAYFAGAGRRREQIRPCAFRRRAAPAARADEENRASLPIFAFEYHGIVLRSLPAIQVVGNVPSDIEHL